MTPLKYLCLKFNLDAQLRFKNQFLFKLIIFSMVLFAMHNHSNITRLLDGVLFPLVAIYWILL